MTEELISTTEAARRMAQALDPADAEASKSWERFLRNNANQARKVANRIPVQKIGGRTAYLAQDIGHAVELEKLRRLGSMTLSRRAVEALSAFGVGQGGSSTGFPWEATITDAFDEGTARPFVQLAVVKPRLTVYRLELAQAAALALELAQAVRDAEAVALRMKRE